MGLNSVSILDKPDWIARFLWGSKQSASWGNRCHSDVPSLGEIPKYIDALPFINHGTQ